MYNISTMGGLPTPHCGSQHKLLFQASTNTNTYTNTNTNTNTNKDTADTILRSTTQTPI